ncbi:hypothetical protein CbuK_1860 [Coxiella burnetii CbuK_Q154]|uniref:Uncharacterized protein n=1 Tax=Coxiella burnetii (strain Dugway 5J108-111) TaxID=434922 RepID=A9KDK9_COXBN|nr:hypothetical protein CBUD_0360 [Coxiella burnetii Dugway 5J108-111]ABX78817.1 hypothetical protein COXBURSA331_A1822 [Coxiella burnetii RSA 331]ACJ17817.1 hypothetical protein CbuG_0385 [Coxiella burnetii CbuG_Q212]ACJ20977.1 hypothetical protein CbuK_1860 [Coxiella burnetii CbuK_Q154]EDR36556.1 hypothetical protein COXBURSA334_0320 [Coxiella burnetii Q321]
MQVYQAGKPVELGNQISIILYSESRIDEARHAIVNRAILISYYLI